MDLSAPRDIWHVGDCEKNIILLFVSINNEQEKEIQNTLAHPQESSIDTRLPSVHAHIHIYLPPNTAHNAMNMNITLTE